MENDSNSDSNNPSSSAPSGPGAQPTEEYAKSTRPGSSIPGWGKAAALAALVVLASIGYFSDRFQQPAKPTTDAATASDGDPDDATKRPAVKDFILTDAEGKQKKLSDYRGEVVILSFWASWCTPCLIELPTFAEIKSKFASRGLEVVAVNVDEGDEGKVFAHDFWAKKKFDFPTFFDSSKALSEQFQIDMLPSNFVIDRQGRLAFSGFGANDWSSGQTVDFLESLLQEK